jgi:hypothetical protein
MLCSCLLAPSVAMAGAAEVVRWWRGTQAAAAAAACSPAAAAAAAAAGAACEQGGGGSSSGAAAAPGTRWAAAVAGAVAAASILQDAASRVCSICMPAPPAPHMHGCWPRPLRGSTALRAVCVWRRMLRATFHELVATLPLLAEPASGQNCWRTLIWHASWLQVLVCWLVGGWRPVLLTCCCVD